MRLSTKPASFDSVVWVEGRTKILGWIITGLVVVLAALTIIIVRSSAQPDPPNLAPVEVSPEPTASRQNPSEEPAPEEEATSDGSGGASSGNKRIEHSYEPAPKPPPEVHDDDDDDDDGTDDDDSDDDD